MNSKIIWKEIINLSDLLAFSKNIKIDIKQEKKKQLYQKAIKVIGSKKRLARKIDILIEILSRPKANYYEIDKEILQFLTMNRKKKYTTTEITWNIKRRKCVVGNALYRLHLKNSIEKENNTSRHGSYLYYTK